MLMPDRLAARVTLRSLMLLLGAKKIDSFERSLMIEWE
jgi:hypothetical protein